MWKRGKEKTEVNNDVAGVRNIVENIGIDPFRSWIGEVGEKVRGVDKWKNENTFIRLITDDDQALSIGLSRSGLGESDI